MVVLGDGFDAVWFGIYQTTSLSTDGIKVKQTISVDRASFIAQSYRFVDNNIMIRWLCGGHPKS